MKKFIRSKIDFTENSNQSLLGPEHSPSASPEHHTTKEEQEALLEKAKSVQPSLPPAPPDMEIDPNLPPKQQTDINEYENNNQTSSIGHAQQNNSVQPVSKSTICRDFIRGTCKRGAVCRYAHECDLSQLPGVYKFCRDFQNAVCVLPFCRYVHATVFEEQRFYRTGKLPAHAFSHHKKQILLPPPPPPPATEPPPPPQEQVYTKPAVLNMRRVDKSTPKPAETSHKQVIKCVPTATLEARPGENVFTKPPPQEHVFAKPILGPRRVKRSTKPAEPPQKQVIKCVPASNLEVRPVKNDYRVSDPPRDLDANTEKCANCETMEFRLQFNKDKYENMKRSTEDLKHKVRILTWKTHTLYTVLTSLMKPQAAKLRPDGLSRLSALLNMANDSGKDSGERNLALGIREL